MNAAGWTTANIPDLNGKVALVTGANSGIGWETALALARAGAEVILSVRTDGKGEDAIERIRRYLPQARLRHIVLDLASQDSVRKVAAALNQEQKLDLLINNAGVMSIPERHTTEDGYELQFATNYLGPFALTCLLMPLLGRSPAPRVTMVSSGAANMGPKKINFSDPQWAGWYSPWHAYCQSKLADLMFALELARRCASAGLGLLSNAAHPGFAMTNIQTSGPGRPQNPIESLVATFLSQDAAHGALPILRAATELDAKPGSYYAPDGWYQLKGNPVLVPIPPPAQDESASRRLWEVSQTMTTVSFGF